MKLLATSVLIDAIMALWFSPKRYRPWCRAALLVVAALVITLRNPDAFRDEA